MTRPCLALLLAAAVLLGGCVGTTAENLDAEPTASSTADDRRVRDQLPVREEGRYGTRVQACSSDVGGCEPPARLTGERTFVLDPPGNVTSLELTMRWEPASPVMEQLRFGVTWGCNTGEGCDGSALTDGTSPLSVSVDDVDVAGELLVWAWRSPETDDPARVYASHEQPFTVEGELALLVGASTG